MALREITMALRKLNSVLMDMPEYDPIHDAYELDGGIKVKIKRPIEIGPARFYKILVRNRKEPSR